MSVVETVERWRSLPGAFVDSGFRQGRDEVLQQLETRSGQDESALVDVYLSGMQSDIETLRRRATPYAIPGDYILFLETYAGFSIEEDDRYYLNGYGIGPYVEEMYGSTDSDTALETSTG